MTPRLAARGLRTTRSHLSDLALPMRVGIGLDVHSRAVDRPLVLGGVSIPGAVGCTAEADGDSLSRAVADALLGAAGLGRITERVTAGPVEEPDSRSLELLSTCVRRLEEENYQVVNVDVMLLGYDAQVDAQRDEIRARLAQVVHTAPDQVSVRRVSFGALVGVAAADNQAAIAVALVDQMQDIDVVHATMRSGG